MKFCVEKSLYAAFNVLFLPVMSSMSIWNQVSHTVENSCHLPLFYNLKYKKIMIRSRDWYLILRNVELSNWKYFIKSKHDFWSYLPSFLLARSSLAVVILGGERYHLKSFKKGMETLRCKLPRISQRKWDKMIEIVF